MKLKIEQRKNSLCKFIIYIAILFIALFIITKLLGPGKTKTYQEVTTSIIADEGENYTIYVEYPRFHNDAINSIITNKVYSYIKEFKDSNETTKVLDMTYELYYIKDHVNITFHIQNTLNSIKNQNLIINLKDEKLEHISNIYDADYLKKTILDLVYYKYSNEIYKSVKESTINNFTYLISDEKIDIYFNNIELKNIDYIPFVTIKLNTDITNVNETVDPTHKKYIAFTYDDGPSKYTYELIKTLELNNSSATFFMIGNRMKNSADIVTKIYNSNSEIGSHSYSHKDLANISQTELNDELNSTNIIFNAITKDNLKYLRPPYNSYNDNLINQGYKIISWNIDPKDWLLKDSDKIYNNVISSACDGCIVIMHDIYEETIEATKKLIPKLNEMGYEVVSISKLAEIKNYDFKPNDVTTIIRSDE